MATKKKSGAEEKVKAKKGAKAEEADNDEDDESEESDTEDEVEDEAPVRAPKMPARVPKVAKVERPGRSDATAAPKKKAPAPIPVRTAGQAPVYQQSMSYSVGDVIYHPVWETEGKVLEVGETSQGRKKIIVDFPGLGKKVLVASYVEEEAPTAN